MHQENKSLFNRTEMIEELEKIFETDRVILIPWDRLEIYGHADGMLRFIDNDTVLINWIFKYDNNFRERLLKPLRDKHIEFEWMDLKTKKVRSYNWAYINFLQTENLILIPKFGIEEDDLAFEQIKMYYRSYSDRIHLIESNQIARRDGALNCISWTVFFN